MRLSRRFTPLFAILLVVVVAFSMTACSDKKADSVDDTQSEVTQQDTSPVQAEEPQEPKDQEQPNDELADSMFYDAEPDILPEEPFTSIEQQVIDFKPVGSVMAVGYSVTEDLLPDLHSAFDKTIEYEGLPLDNVVITPLTADVQVTAERVEFVSATDDLAPTERLWEEKIQLGESGVVRVPLIEGIPTVRLTLVMPDKTLHWYNLFPGVSSQTLDYYFDDMDIISNPEGMDNITSNAVIEGYNVLHTYDEIQDAINEGKSLRYFHMTEMLDGVECPVFELGTIEGDYLAWNTDNRFYAYNQQTDTVYTTNTESGEWDYLGLG